TETIMAVFLLLFVLSAGTAWVLAVQSVPAADSGYVVDAALGAAGNDYAALDIPYFRWFPYQLGYVRVAEWIVRLSGAEAGAAYLALALSNVAALAAAYAALLAIVRRVHSDSRVFCVTALLLALCWQPVLYCTFQYGTLPGLACALWSAALLLRYMQTRSMASLIAASLLMAFAVLSKPNYLIFLTALVLYLLLEWVRSGRLFHVAAAGLLAACALCALPLAQAHYEARSGIDFGEGTPQTAWLAMGLQESERAPGWYNRYSYAILEENGYDAARTREAIAADFRARLQFMRQEPAYTIDFFTKKVLSQWNEPSFESIWISQVKRHAIPISGFVESVYTGDAGARLLAYFNQYVQIIYAAFLAGLMAAFRRPSGGLALLPLIVLGGFLYHLLFEAKSQYILIYLPLLLPTAALGIRRFSDMLAGALPGGGPGMRRRSAASGAMRETAP
ncbi:MAG: glycosyltransferase family 39 protein, partial [Clostridia bacterium]|nr:glycosyltransferase family 39 protein [Clostridia bacterium]